MFGRAKKESRSIDRSIDPFLYLPKIDNIDLAFMESSLAGVNGIRWGELAERTRQPLADDVINSCYYCYYYWSLRPDN